MDWTPTEAQEQEVLVEWLNLKHIPFYHIPNGGYRRLTEAKRFKRLGVQAGIPDICIPIARNGYHSLYIEMKRQKKSKISDAQLKWIGILEKLGHRVVVMDGAEKAIRFITEYLE